MLGRRRHVAALDAVRALAVLGVLCTHADVPFVKGGPLGVDVFFVLSGFLITTLLIGERADSGRVSLGRFYVRRGLRLLPALFVVLAFTLVVAGLANDLPSSAYQSIAVGHAPAGGLFVNTIGEALAALFYVADFAYVFGIEDVFLGHTWSLALEEQFYAIWPVTFVVLTARASLPRRIALMTAAMATLLVVRLAGIEGPGHFFQLRADQILLGVTVALALAWRPTLDVIGRLWPIALAVIALAFVTGPESPGTLIGRSAYTFVGMATAVLVLACWTDKLGRARPIFALAPIVFIGRISYGLYLWHLPIFRRVALADLDLPGPAIVAVKFTLVFTAAVACWFLVERPALRFKARFETTPEGAATVEANAA
jgi:peptidoglycan/LPS O-acetylase OafA/YrhL